jgi:hypothetical protein
MPTVRHVRRHSAGRRPSAAHYFQPIFAGVDLMESASSLLMLLAGLAVDFACAWLINRGKASSILEAARASVGGELARLKAQLEASESC